MIRIVPRPGEDEHTLRALRSFSDSVRAQPGCTASALLREVGEPAALVYTETWQDVAHFEQHVVAPSYDLVLGLIESSAEAPTIEYRLGSETRGLAWVESLRRRARTPASPKADDELQ